MELKKHEHDLQFSLWLFASILLHLLLILILFTWYFQQSIERYFLKKEPTLIPSMIDPAQLKQEQVPKEEKKKAPVLWKDLKKPDNKEQLTYTLIPGRQAVTEPKTETQKDTSAPPKEKSTIPDSIPQPSIDQKMNNESTVQAQPLPEKATPQPIIPEQAAPIAKPKESIIQKSQPLAPKQLSISPVQDIPDEKINKAPEKVNDQDEQKQRHDDLKRKILLKVQDVYPDHHSFKQQPSQKQADAKEESPDSKNQSESTNNPTIVKNKVTLQDLKLGFSKFLQEGNNDILLQKGNTNEPPDAKALKLITYNQQVAHTMRDAVISHDQYHRVRHIRGSRPAYIITIDRSGKLVDLQFITSSGNELFDKIIQEALRSIKFYPAIPQYITGDTYRQQWVYLH